MTRTMIALPTVALGVITAGALLTYSAFAARPVSFWVAHPEMLRQQMHWCHEHPGDGGAECINAFHAELHIYNQSLLSPHRH